MTGDVHNSMKREEERRDEGRDPETLVRSFPQRKHTPDEQDDSGNGQHDRRPTRLGPEPEPVALGMNGSGARQRDVAKDGKHFIEISEPDAAPGRRADEVKRIPKDRPAQVARDAGVTGPKVKALEGLAAEEQQHREQNQEH